MIREVGALLDNTHRSMNGDRANSPWYPHVGSLPEQCELILSLQSRQAEDSTHLMFFASIPSAVDTAF